MDDKLIKTVDKTIQALARIERFIEKYGNKLDDKSMTAISNKLKELQAKIK